jgi:hypothetical protein
MRLSHLGARNLLYSEFTDIQSHPKTHSQGTKKIITHALFELLVQRSHDLAW